MIVVNTQIAAELPWALLRAIEDVKSAYGNRGILNTKQNNYPIDREFERIHNCRIVYDSDRVIRIIWDRDADYTAFLLKWA